MKYYTATKSRSQGREGWSVIFRHPVRLDAATNKPRRVRRGLSTTDEAEAARLVEQLNELLRTEELWEPASRTTAEGRFDARVIQIFYDGLEATRTDFTALREALIPLPTAVDGYRKVLLLGTTGAGKTTVVRQLLGTDPKTERFPSTSTAKTTVADTELITRDASDDSLYRGAVTFAPRDEVIDYLTENVSAAALAAYRRRPDAEITRRMLDHVNQRFRFSYILGRGTVADSDDLADDDVEDEVEEIDPEDYGEIELADTARLIADAVTAVKSVVARYADDVVRNFQDIEEDELVLAELIEENLDTELRESEEFHQIVDALIDEIEKRFTLLTVGDVARNRQGWPTTWSWQTPLRDDFMKVITRFSSNYAPLFGRLLTPLVNGIRVSGPFQPQWTNEPVRLVLIDGEGLGHTPKSMSTLSTHVTQRLDEVDAVLLVDNATQPMQAAPVGALKSIAVSGKPAKLHFLFTHFDQVKGDNLPTFSEKEEHVLASIENVLSSISDEIGPIYERALRQRLDRARFFVGDIQEPLKPGKRSGHRAIEQFRSLIALLTSPEIVAEGGPNKPVYDRMNLSLAVTEAAKAFHSKWRGLLGLDASGGQHWTRIKALTRRLAEGWGDEYDTLKPVADLLYELQRQISLMLQRPVRWESGEPDDDGKQAIILAISNAITEKLMQLTRQRLADDVRVGWQTAYVQRGVGSTFIRARIIANDVYDRGAPVPTASASPDQNRFLKDVAALVTAVAEDLPMVLE